MARRGVRRWLLEPVWTAAPAPKREEWSCPACGRTVWRDSPAWKGIWFAPTPLELTGRCARQHGAHRRRSADPLPEEEPGGRPPVDDRVPVVHLAGGGFVALLPPAGLRFDPVGGTGDEDDYDVWSLDELLPSDLVGSAPPRGRHLGRLARSNVVLDGDLLEIPAALMHERSRGAA